MEEKKLTDDTEIDVGMIEEATEAVKNNQNAGCYVGDLLRIIHRLQSENKRLNDIEFTQEHCDLYSENEWLKAELKRECEEHEEFTKKAKEEIERLTERLDYFEKSSDYHEGNQRELESKNAELQKQVDELKEERDVFKNLFEHCNNSSITIDQIIESMNSFYREQAEHLAELKIEQAAKDTAKEILGDILAKEFEKGDYLTDDELTNLFAEKYGVEVE